MRIVPYAQICTPTRLVYRRHSRPLHEVGPLDIPKGVWRSLLRQQYFEELGTADLLAKGILLRRGVLGAIGVPRFNDLRGFNSRRSTAHGDRALLDWMSLDPR